MPCRLSIVNLIAALVVAALLVGVIDHVVRGPAGKRWVYSPDHGDAAAATDAPAGGDNANLAPAADPNNPNPAPDMNNANNPPATIVIKKAVYGDLPNGGQTDITQAVADSIKNGSTIVVATNGNFGDPAPGVYKKMQIDYTIDGKDYSKTVNENETLTLGANGN